MSNNRRTPGLFTKTEPPVSDERVEEFFARNAWITIEFLEETKRVWSKAYGREVSDSEAVEILSNVKRLAEVLMEVQKG